MPILSGRRFLMASYTWRIVHPPWTPLICSPNPSWKLSFVSLGMISGWWSCPQGGVKFEFLCWIHVYDDNFTPRRIFCYIVLILLYTFMVSSLCMRNLLYKFLEQKVGQSSIVQLSMCEELLCIFWHCSVIHMQGTLMCILFCSTLFSYPCVRNSYVSFGIIQLSICEELLCAFLMCPTLYWYQHMFYI